MTVREGRELQLYLERGEWRKERWKEATTWFASKMIPLGRIPLWTDQKVRGRLACDEKISCCFYVSMNLPSAIEWT
jgi:hypothetical protein